MEANPLDGSAVQVVPLPIERVPLFHWRPASRVLVVGSRDGACFDPDWQAAEARTFRRPLDAALVNAALTRGGCTATVAAWSESLRFVQGLGLLRALGAPLIVATSGRGSRAVVDELLPEVAAWLVLVHRDPGEHVPAILAAARHVEIQLALDADVIVPALPWDRVSAVHLVPRRPADDPTARRAWYAAARAQLPASVTVYDEDQLHSECPCGARLIWRSGGASRRDALSDAGTCSSCGRQTALTLV